MLVTLDEAKEVLNIEDKDDLLENIIKRASAVIENYTNREFLAQDLEEEFEGTGSREYPAKQYPINSIAKLSIRTGRLGEDSWQEIDSGSYTFKKDSGIVIYSSRFVPRHRMYKLEYNAGYTNIPDDIKQAVIDMTAFLFSTKDGREVRSERIGDYQITYQDMEDSIKTLGLGAMLDSYINYRQ